MTEIEVLMRLSCSVSEMYISNILLPLAVYSK